MTFAQIAAPAPDTVQQDLANVAAEQQQQAAADAAEQQQQDAAYQQNCRGISAKRRISAKLHISVNCRGE